MGACWNDFDMTSVKYIIKNNFPAYLYIQCDHHQVILN